MFSHINKSPSTVDTHFVGFENMNSLTVKSVKANGSHLAIDFECRGNISEFLQTNQFYADYDTSIQAVPEEILVMPFLAADLAFLYYRT